MTDLATPFKLVDIARSQDTALTPYAMKPPKIPAHPLNEYQMRARNGTSLCAYQIDVKIVSPGVTMASRSPRKNLSARSTQESLQSPGEDKLTC